MIWFYMKMYIVEDSTFLSPNRSACPDLLFVLEAHSPRHGVNRVGKKYWSSFW